MDPNKWDSLPPGVKENLMKQMEKKGEEEEPEMEGHFRKGVAGVRCRFFSDPCSCYVLYFLLPR